MRLVPRRSLMRFLPPLRSARLVRIVVLALPCPAIGGMAALAGPPQDRAAYYRLAGQSPTRVAQLTSTDVVLRLERVEEQIRQLTGVIEQLQYRSQQLEQQLARVQEGGDSPLRGAPRPGPAAPPAPAVGEQTPLSPPGGQR